MNKKFKLASLMFLAVVALAFWASLQKLDKNSNRAYYFEAFLAFVPIYGGVIGTNTAKHWSGMKSRVGKGIIFISLGLVAWGIGQAAWAYLNLRGNVEIPYPSLADVGYLTAVPLWAIGVYQLSKATGAKYAAKTSVGKASLFAVPLIGLAITYELLVSLAHNGSLILSTDAAGNTEVLKAFFDLAYPLSDAIIIAFVATIVWLSWKYLGGRFRVPILFTLAGFIVEYFADFAFTYTVSKNTFYNGSYVDILFATAMITISVGLALLDPSDTSKKPVAPLDGSAPPTPMAPVAPPSPQGAL